MKLSIILFALIIQACGAIPTFSRNIECMDSRTGKYFEFNTDEVTSVSGFGYGKGPFFVKDYKDDYILIDYVAASFLTCSEKMITDENTHNKKDVASNNS